MWVDHPQRLTLIAKVSSQRSNVQHRGSLGLGFLSRLVDDREYTNTLYGTISLFENRKQISDKEYEEFKLLSYELRLIKREKLDSVYKELIEAVVSPFVPSPMSHTETFFSNSRSRETRENGTGVITSRKRRMFYMCTTHKIE